MSKITIEVNDPRDPRDKELLGSILRAEAQMWSDALTTIRKTNDNAHEKPTLTQVNLSAELGPDGSHVGTKIKAFTRKFADGRTVKTTPPKIAVPESK